MSKKLLEEQAVRKFMKIAGLQPLTNSFLKESTTSKDELEESVEDLDESKDELEEAYGDKKPKKPKMEESEELDESKDELEEGGGQIPFDESSRRADERAPDDRVNEAKKMTASVKGKGAKQPSHSLSKLPVRHNGSSGKSLVNEEESSLPEADVPADDIDMEDSAPPGDLDVEALVKDLVDVITARVPGARDMISVESDEGETEVEMGDEGEESMEGGEKEEAPLDEEVLQSVVAETIKRVKSRLMESQKKSSSSMKEALAKKVAAKVASRLKSK